MAQLVTVIISIVLLAVVVAGGSGYLRSDTGVRISSAENVVTGFAVLEAAIRSYRIANRGVSPTTEEAAGEPDLWAKELAPYLPDGRVPRVEGFEWSYAGGEAGKVICLTPAGAGEAALKGLNEAADRIGAAAGVCGGAVGSIGKAVN